MRAGGRPECSSPDGRMSTPAAQVPARTKSLADRLNEVRAFQRRETAVEIEMERAKTSSGREALRGSLAEARAVHAKAFHELLCVLEGLDRVAERSAVR
jgi:hypothetical protein